MGIKCSALTLDFLVNLSFSNRTATTPPASAKKLCRSSAVAYTYCNEYHYPLINDDWLQKKVLARDDMPGDSDWKRRQCIDH